MRITDILEAKKQTKTQTSPRVDLGPDLSPPEFQPLEPQRPSQGQERESGTTSAPEFKKASQSDTLRASQSVFTPDMAQMLSRMRDIDVDPDDPGYPTDPSQEVVPHVTVDNLPAVAQGNLAAAGIQNPDWHKVANLPGNMRQGIRRLGRELFGSMTNTPTDEIYMVGDLGGRGPNSHLEVNSVMNWIQEHGQDLGPGDIDFDRIIPGYQAETHQYSAGGIRWLVVQDQFGNYIYAWPEDQSKNIANNDLLPRPEVPRLR